MTGSSLGHRAITLEKDFKSSPRGGVTNRTTRSVDKYNIATTNEGKKGPFGLINWGRTGKVTSNVKADGGYKINPMVDANTIRKQYENQDFEALNIMDYSGNAK